MGERLAAPVARHPRAVVAAFLALFILTLPVLAQLTVYINVYDVSPRTAYYDDYVVLNQEMGWDNLAFVLVTPQAEESVVTPRAIREMDAVGQRLEALPYVNGTISMATVVKLLHQTATGRYELPPEGPAGDALIEQYVDVALDQFGEDVLYGRVLAPHHESGLIIVTMPTGVDVEKYRPWQRDLLGVGLDVDENNPYHDALEMRPLSLDIIWVWVEKSTVEEGPLWVAFAAAAATLSLYALFRRTPEVAASLVTLIIVMATTLAAAYGVGVRFNLLSMVMMALIFGLGVDYCMHVTARFREERALGAEREEAVAKAIRHVGTALFVSAVTTTIGFASLYFSLIPAIGMFGVMLGVGVFTAFLAAITFLPAILVLIDRRRDPAVYADAFPAGEADRAGGAVREAQKRSLMGRLGRWAHDRPAGVLGATAVAVVLLALPIATNGVQVWTGSYLEPHPVLEEDLYPMETLMLANEVFGIPVDLAIMVYGDATDPEVVRLVKDIHQASAGVHGRLNTESLLFPLEFYLNFTQEGRMCGCDDDGDGIPDTRADLERAYAYLRNDPAMSLPVQRVLTPDNRVTAVRMGINPGGTTVDLGTDVANYRQSRADAEAVLAEVREAHPGMEDSVDYSVTGLVVLGVEVVDAIVRGNASSIGVMLAVIFAVLTWFWRQPVVTLIVMVPVFAAVLVQYSVTALMGFEVTYVSLIITGGAAGIGIDDGVHLVSRIREEVTRGRDAREAVTLATAEVGAVLAGTTVTDVSAFFLVIFSYVVWGSQTALMVAPTLAAAFVATVVVLPAIVGIHAGRHPEKYRMREKEPVAAAASPPTV